MNQSRKKSVPGQPAASMTRNMIRQQMSSMVYGGSWFPATDVYETATAIIVHMDISGMDPRTLSVVADGTQLTVSGVREYESRDTLSCIHQLEIERGFFERSISLPKRVDVAGAVAESRNGVLRITLPLPRNAGKIKITVG